MPDPDTAILDPFTEAPTLSMICDDRRTRSRASRTRATRATSRSKAEAVHEVHRHRRHGYFGPEAEFFVFDDVRYDQRSEHARYYYVDSHRGHWNTGRDEVPNLGYKPRTRKATSPSPPHDTLHDLRTEMMLTIEGRHPVEVHHHEVATAGQCEIDMRFDTLLEDGRQAAHATSTSSRTSRAQHGKIGDVHAQAALRRQRLGHAHATSRSGRTASPCSPATATPGYQRDRAVLHRRPAQARAGAAGLLRADDEHVQAAGAGLRGAGEPRLLAAQPLGVRPHPDVPRRPKAKRIEFRCPDPTANPYLAFSAMLMAGLDGIEKKLDPGEPADFDLFEDDHGVKQVPGSGAQALNRTPATSPRRSRRPTSATPRAAAPARRCR